LNSSPKNRFAHKSSLITILLALLITLGIFFRVRQYAFDRSLWLDEASLSLNIIQRPLDRLLTEPLENNQAAPLGLLLLAKWSVMWLGETDLVLRIVPLVFGILVLFLGLDVSRHAFQSDAARVGFLGLLAVAPILVYYSSEIKQYGIDACVTVLLLWASFRFSRHDAVSLLALSLVGSLAVWLAHPSVFVLAAMGAAFVIQSLARRDLRSTIKYVLVAAVWLVNFWAAYVISFSAIASNTYLVSYWKSGYAPLSLDGIAWYWESALGLVYLAFRQTDLTVVTPLAEWFDGWNIILLSVLAIGLWSLFKHSRPLFSVVVIAIAVTTAVSAFELYPFRNRMLLFLVPLIFIVAGAAIDWLARRRPSLAWAAAAGLVFTIISLSIPFAIHPHNAYDIKGALSYIRTHRSPDEAIALQFWSQPAFEVYKKSFAFDDLPLAATLTIDANVDALLKSICASPTPRRTWIVFSHNYEQHIAVVERLSTITPRLDSWEGDNAGAFLFDFSSLGENCNLLSMGSLQK
jgi:hypothetical protein